VTSSGAQKASETLQGGLELCAAGGERQSDVAGRAKATARHERKTLSFEQAVAKGLIVGQPETLQRARDAYESVETALGPPALETG
jgi:hypothetical protein